MTRNCFTLSVIWVDVTAPELIPSGTLPLVFYFRRLPSRFSIGIFFSYSSTTGDDVWYLYAADGNLIEDAEGYSIDREEAEKVVTLMGDISTIRYRS